MIRLDSTKIKADIRCIEGLNMAYFNDSNISDETAVLKQCKELKKDTAIGLNNIKIDELNGTAEFLISSKILADDYAAGINKNNIERIADTINKTGIIKIDIEHLISTGVCLNTDETHHINIEDLINNWKDTSTALSCSIVNKKYASMSYRAANNKGIVFSSNLTSKKERLIMYCKNVELQIARNKNFLKTCSNPARVLNEAKNILRIEANNSSFKTIRERFGLRPGAPMIADVLTATGKPCLHYLNDITQPKKNEQLELIMQSEYTGRLFLEQEGLNTIIRACNYDIHAVRLIIESKFTPANFQKYWYGRNNSNRPGIEKQIYNLIAQDNKQPIAGNMNPVIQNIIKQLEHDYSI